MAQLDPPLQAARDFARTLPQALQRRATSPSNATDDDVITAARLYADILEALPALERDNRAQLDTYQAQALREHAETVIDTLIRTIAARSGRIVSAGGAATATRDTVISQAHACIRLIRAVCQAHI